MKLLIAVDVGEIKPNQIIVGVYDPKYREIDIDQLKGLPVGTIISFDEYYLKTDREDDSFKEAEFYGIIE